MHLRARLVPEIPPSPLLHHSPASIRLVSRNDLPCPLIEHGTMFVHVFNNLPFHTPESINCRTPITPIMTRTMLPVYLRRIACSQSPTPAVCGHTNTPNLHPCISARQRGRPLIWPPSEPTHSGLHASICAASTASPWNSSLNVSRLLCACSPVATPVPYGASARLITACSSTSSGAVGSPMN